MGNHFHTDGTLGSDGQVNSVWCLDDDDGESAPEVVLARGRSSQELAARDSCGSVFGVGKGIRRKADIQCW
jgi:hypothetical protein